MQQGGQRRLLFRLFLVRPPAAFKLSATRRHAHLEALRMVGAPFVEDQVHRRAKPFPLEDLLQDRFEIMLMPEFRRMLDPRLE